MLVYRKPRKNFFYWLFYIKGPRVCKNVVNLKIIQKEWETYVRNFSY